MLKCVITLKKHVVISVDKRHLKCKSVFKNDLKVCEISHLKLLCRLPKNKALSENAHFNLSDINKKKDRILYSLCGGLYSVVAIFASSFSFQTKTQRSTHF